MALIPVRCWILLPCSGHFAWHWARQCTDTRAFFIAALSIIFFFQWLSRADRVLTLNMNIWLPLFWSTWSRAWGPDSATCAGLAHGLDYSDCRASELKKQKSLAFVFPWIVENTWKTKATLEGFSTLIPQTGENWEPEIENISSRSGYAWLVKNIVGDYLNLFSVAACSKNI